MRPVAFSPDGQYLATTGADNSARLWNTASGTEIMQVTHGPYDNITIARHFCLTFISGSI